MSGERFELNGQTMSIVEGIGRHMPGGFFIYKAAAPEELLYANQAVIDIFGCDDLDDFKALTGYTFKGMLHPDDYRAISDSIAEQIEASDDNFDYVEYRIIRKDGSIRWVDDYGHYTDTDEHGGIYYVFISDITEKHEQRAHDLAAKQLEADQARMKEAEARQKEMETRLALQGKLLEKERQRAEQDRLITALASDYRGVYYVVLDTDEGVCYQEHPELADGLAEGEHFSFRRDIANYGRKYVTPEYRDEFMAFIDPANIRNGLMSERVISFRFLVDRGGAESYEMIRFAGVRHPEDRDDGIVHAVSMCFSDVDAETRKGLEQTRALGEALSAAEEANKAKTVFLSNMSHEIRTPMNAIIGLDSIALSNENLPPETREQLEKIGSSAQHLLSIINDILDMSRIESGKMTVNNEEFSLGKTLEQVNTIVGGQCRDKGLAYECQVEGDVGDHYIGDDMKLRQVMINILGNAVKFTPAGGKVTFAIREIARFDGKSTLQFTISDTGIGMAGDFLPRIFDTFSQENTSAKNEYGSTGLGMPITKNLVELMNGAIEVKSAKGEGTTFTVTLTLTESRRETAAHDTGELRETPGEKDRLGPHEGAELSGRRVLLAEDVAINAEIIIMVLAMRDMKAEVAENGQIAVDMFATSEQGYYDAVLMDMRMPVMNGLEATRAIRAMNRPDATEVPIVALTANAFDEDVQRSMQAGLNAHLSKPVEPDALFATLETLIGKREP